MPHKQLPPGTGRARDLALLSLLAGCGLRSQEAADLQLRDLDLDGMSLTVRKGKGGKARRVPLAEEALRRLRDYMRVRCPEGIPQIGSATEREQLLVAFHRGDGREGWTPGMTTAGMRKRLTELGAAAAELVQQQARKEQRLARLGELEALARQLRAVSPHQLRHSLGYRLRRQGVDLGAIQTILGHSRLETTRRYGAPTQDDLREALHRASDIGARP